MMQIILICNMFIHPDYPHMQIIRTSTSSKPHLPLTPLLPPSHCLPPLVSLPHFPALPFLRPSLPHVLQTTYALAVESISPCLERTQQKGGKAARGVKSAGGQSRTQEAVYRSKEPQRTERGEAHTEVCRRRGGGQCRTELRSPSLKRTPRGKGGHGVSCRGAGQNTGSQSIFMNSLEESHTEVSKAPGGSAEHWICSLLLG